MRPSAINEFDSKPTEAANSQKFMPISFLKTQCDFVLCDLVLPWLLACLAGHRISTDLQALFPQLNPGIDTKLFALRFLDCRGILCRYKLVRTGVFCHQQA